MRVTIPLAILSGAAAFVLSVHAGRIGFMPLDESIVFDGAWRMASGQVPWRDFMMPNGLFPIGTQALIFKIAGVSWWSYVAHAGAINAAAAILVFAYLHAGGLPRVASLSCALATGVWLYPPFGVTYVDQHSLFFAGAAVALCCHAARTGRAGWWVAAGIAAGLGLMSKQIPLLLVLPVAAVTLIGAPLKHVVRGAALAAAACLVTVAVFLGGVLLAGARMSDLIEFGWLLPADIGRVRMNGSAWRMDLTAKRLWSLLPLTHWCAVGLVVATFARLVARRLRAGHPLDHGTGELLMHMACAGGLAVTTIAAIAMTQNNFDMEAGLLPFAAGLLLLAWMDSATASGDRGSRPWLNQAVVGAFCAAMLADAAAGYQRVALSRSGHDMEVTAADRATPIAPVLKASGFSVWAVPGYYASITGSFGPLVDWFAAHPGNFFVAGDESALYGLTGRPSVAPLLWIHPGLTFRTDDAGYRRVDDLLEERLARYAVRWVVFPENRPWLDMGDGPYRRFRAWRDHSGCERVGTYRVCELSQRPD